MISFSCIGIDTIRRSKFLNNELPSPRHISNEIYAEQERRAARKTFVDSMQLMQANKICNGKPNYSKPIDLPWKNQPREYTFSFLGYMFGQLVAVDTANRIITKGPGNLAILGIHDHIFTWNMYSLKYLLFCKIELLLESNVVEIQAQATSEWGEKFPIQLVYHSFIQLMIHFSVNTT